MGKLIRSYDWSKTPLGPVSSWPRSLKTSIGIMLQSPYPMFVWWGREMIMFHNDAYVPVLGKRHPEALGKSGPVVWADVWEFIGPLMYDVLDNGKSCYFKNQLLIPERKGFKEETYFTFSYSPIPDDHSGVGGIFCVCSEDTKQVLGQRRLNTLRKLSEISLSTTAKEVFDKAAAVLRENAHDIPFGLFYELVVEGTIVKLERSFGTYKGTPYARLPAEVESSIINHFTFNPALAGPFVIDELDKFDFFPTGPWEEKPLKALVLPLKKSGQDQLVGFFASGISARLEFDDDYKSFLTLVAGQISTAIDNALVLQEERSRMQKLLELDKAKTDFFSNVSHEFRTPLTLMLGPLEKTLSQSNTSLSETDREELTTVYTNSLRLFKLVNTLLDFSRIEARRMQATFQATDLCLVTSEIVAAFDTAATEAGLKYNISCRPMSEDIYVDSELWEKIVFNLISNALKFTFEGSISIELSETDTDAKLYVRDTGIGIPKHALPRLFTRFYRVENSRSRTYEGSGIGLALVKELVDLHHGTIEVESEEGKGTTFTVSIPKGTSHLEKGSIVNQRDTVSFSRMKEAYLSEAHLWNKPYPDLEVSTDEVVSVSRNDKDGYLLIVDDNPDMRKYLYRLLSPYWSIKTVADGIQAMVEARNEPPALILSDVMMPKMNGFDLLAEVRKDSGLKNTPVILLSARIEEDATIEGLEKGANDYLHKPFSARVLIARVKTQLELRRTKREIYVQKELNEQLEKLVAERTKELQRSNEDLEQFAYAASHDLKEPARKVAAFGGRLMDELGEKLTEKGKLYIQKIESASQRMSSLIDGLLHYSSLNSLNNEEHIVNLNKIFQSIESDLELVIQEKGAKIVYENLPAVEGSPILLHQLFYNLVNNSVKFSQKGMPPYVKVTSERLDTNAKLKEGLPANNEYVLIRLQDNGIGFDQADGARLFKTFTRLNPKDQYEGTGLGLAICKRIVGRHRGIIRAEGKKNAGAVFDVILPVSESDRALIAGT